MTVVAAAEQKPEMTGPEIKSIIHPVGNSKPISKSSIDSLICNINLDWGVRQLTQKFLLGRIEGLRNGVLL